MIDKGLLSTVKEFIYRHPPDIAKDQFFLVDLEVIKFLIDSAAVTADDRVLEVGPGLGFITKELSRRAKEVLAIEIDRRFEPYLNKLPRNVTVIYGDAYRLLNDKSFLEKVPSPTKTVSAIPYSQAQNMLHNYTNNPWFRGDLNWLGPLSFVNKVNQESLLGAYFKGEILRKVPRRAFYPQPKTSSGILYFKRIADPRKSGDFSIYLRRWLYNHEHWKLKNALREGLIRAARDLKKVFLTKNQARDLIADLNLPKEDLEKLTANIAPDYYFQLPERLGHWFSLLKSGRGSRVF